jgi:capsular polysaccharide biosynthesis protein
VGTSLIDIEVANRDAGTAAALANAIAEALRAYEADSSGQVLGLTLTVVDPAVVPTSPEGFGVSVQTALGAAIALFLSISLAFFIENLGRGIQGVGRRLPTGAPHDEPRPPVRGRR